MPDEVYSEPRRCQQLPESRRRVRRSLEVQGADCHGRGEGTKYARVAGSLALLSSRTRPRMTLGSPEWHHQALSVDLPVFFLSVSIDIHFRPFSL